ncbi:glycosyltransferase-like domain-containing protein 1 isoform X2 [Mizuhopecten yessoensis]|uniref:tRNA-queuosine alpha-mannosyltransferase n=3 Tax=Mizuhopecten yessoensis TaxID=6573 RepID=A0A210PF58_MIZYE|nr:glycosyltransferase-like domain-containing protein 1 isoform X2 [Mizuhopecten yessoensis]OWF35122.1 Glycosyltransferase-like domain-containing protein 1 [Mizuhopecten yessoensis]
MADEILMVEPFYGGSHRQLIDLLHSHFTESVKVTMTAKKWHWRARTSALHLSQEIPYSSNYRVLFASSVLNLAELVALRPDLSGLRKILYFHENQLVYPVQKKMQRDFQYPYNQILSCLVADKVVFNSQFNMDSFLSSINKTLKTIPDYRPKGLPEKIRPKCQVLYFPLDLPPREKFIHTHQNKPTFTSIDESRKEEEENSSCNPDVKTRTCLGDKFEDCGSKDVKCDMPVHSIEDGNPSDERSCPPDAKRRKTGPLHIVWAHRWEHDKDPETFFNALFQLQEAGLNFRVSVMGEQFTDNPEIFSVAKERLASHIVAWGYQEKKEDFYRILSEADVAVSTALHEFYGVSMLEAVYFGCYPLCPNRLVYPEIFPKTYLFNTPAQLLKKLKRMCTVPDETRRHSIQVPMDRYLWQNCAEDFYALFKVNQRQ